MTAQTIAQRLDRRLNPILVKEIQQGFRGRGLLAGSAGALLFCLGAYAYAALSVEKSGTQLFAVLELCMGAVALVVVPLGAGRQLQKELEDGTLELIAVTGLSPWANIGGRLQAAMLKIVLTFALMAPFALVAVLMGGIGFGEVLVSMATQLQLAISLCAISLALGSLGALPSPVLRLALAGQFLALPLLGYWLVDSIIPELAHQPALTTVAAWLAWGSAMCLLVATLCISLAADMLTGTHSRSFARSKLLFAPVLCGLGFPLMTYELFALPERGVGEALITAMLALLALFGLVWSGARTEARAAWPLAFMGRGFGPTLVYVTVGAAAVYLLSGNTNLEPAARITVWVGYAYFVFLAGGARLLRRLFDRERRQAIFFPAAMAIGATLFVFANALYIDVAEPPHGPLSLMLFPGVFYLNPSAFDEAGLVLVVPILLGLGYAFLGRDGRHQGASLP